MALGHKKTPKNAGNELKYAQELIEAGGRSYTGISWNQRLEEAFTERFGVRYAIAHNSGTSCLHTCLLAAGVGPGDEVISPALTVIMDAFATLYTGATPVFADVDPDTFNIDPESVRALITPRTKAIITVSLYGLSADMDPIMEMAAEHGITVIEDNAQCILGTYKGRIPGGIGHMSIFSFENSKHLATGEGGMVGTNDPALAEHVRKLAGIGYANLTSEAGRVKMNSDVSQSPDYKRHDVIGWNYRLNELSAAIGLAQVERVDEILALRLENAAAFTEAIEGCEWLVPQTIPEGYVHSYYTYGIKYEGESMIGVPWKAFRKAYLAADGDGFYAAWSLPYLEPALAHLGLGVGLCPVAEDLQQKLMHFKTNYRDRPTLEAKTNALRETIRKLEA